jgi:hypothetical protein
MDMRTKTLLIAVALAFAGGIGAAIGWRLPGEAMAVLVGVAAGVGASIPTSLLIVWVTTRQLRAQIEGLSEPERESARAAAPAALPATSPAGTWGQPPVIVVQPAAQAAPGPQWGGGYFPAHAPVAPRREFSVIGDENNWDE